MKGDDLSWTYSFEGNYLQGDDLVNNRPECIMDISRHCLSESRDYTCIMDISRHCLSVSRDHECVMNISRHCLSASRDYELQMCHGHL